MNKPLPLLLALIVSLFAMAPAAAMPKVAENEAAAVTYGADAPKPVRTRAGNANPVEKKRAAKLVHKVKHGKTHRH